MTVQGAVTGKPRTFLRLEGAVLFAGGVWAFLATEEAWWLLPALLLVPDLFMVGYAKSSRAGALLYNVAHSYPLPAGMAAIGVIADQPLLWALALIWFAHIGMDRMFGYGLKYDTGFSDTHLGRIGSDRTRKVSAARSSRS